MTGNRDIEDSLDRLDRLTQEEARMAAAELLKMTQSVDDKVMGVDGRVKDIGGKIRCDVQDVGNMVQSVERRVRDKVQDVDDKLDQANRSLPLTICHPNHSIRHHREPAQR